MLELISLKAVMNKGLSEPSGAGPSSRGPLDLKLAFPNLVLGLRPEISSVKISDPWWLAGFTVAISPRPSGRSMRSKGGVRTMCEEKWP